MESDAKMKGKVDLTLTGSKPSAANLLIEGLSLRLLERGVILPLKKFD
jgi:succinylglutamate desuccinylase